MPPPEASPYEEGSPHGRGAYGIMQLLRNPSADTLGEAARLTGAPEARLKTDRAANVLGGAAVLARIKGAPAPGGDLGAYYDAVAEYGDGPPYANAVYETLRDGASRTISTGERVVLAPQDGAEPRALRVARAAGDYRGSQFYGAADNYTNASRPPRINKIIVHVTQGSWSSAIDWFANPRSNASAHYTVRSSDGFIGQSVREADIAWTAGNWPYNKTGINIEHEGYVSDPDWFTSTMYRSSAQLSAYLCRKYRIPVDRKHIIGHAEVPCPEHPGRYGGIDHHTDPGRFWDWSRYMSLIRTYY